MDYIKISKKKTTKIKKAFFMFFDWLLPDIHWGLVGRLTNKIRIFFARRISKTISYKISLHKGADIYPGIVIEDHVFIGRNVSLDWGVTIKSGTKIGKYASFVTQNWKRDMEKQKFDGLTEIKEITIGSNCWIGEKSIILPGVSIGDFTTIGGGAVVTKNVPPNCLAAGNPAVIKKHYDEIYKETNSSSDQVFDCVQKEQDI